MSLLGIILSFTLTKQAVSQPAWITPIFPNRNIPELQLLQHHPVLFSNAKIPVEAKFCIDSEAERIDLLATAQQPGKTLYLLAAYSDFVSTNPLIPIAVKDELIALHRKGTDQWCERLAPQLNQSIKPLNTLMPPRIALKLELQRYRRWIAQTGGKTKFQQLLTQQIAANHGSYLLSDEQVQALRQLGIDFPSHYRPFTSTTF